MNIERGLAKVEQSGSKVEGFGISNSSLKVEQSGPKVELSTLL